MAYRFLEKKYSGWERLLLLPVLLVAFPIVMALTVAAMLGLFVACIWIVIFGEKEDG